MKPDEFKNSKSGKVLYVPSGYHAFVPNDLPPILVWSEALMQALSDADRSLGELSGLSRSMANPYLLAVPFVRREAVLSSRIEGTRASLTDLFTYEAVQLSLWERQNLDDVREVHNYVQALEYGLGRLSSLPISLRLMRELHARLMTGVRGQERTPGEFRRSQNWIGPPGSILSNAVFVPPPVPEMMDALAQLERYIHEANELPPLVRLGLIHYQFEAIHPFLDGNGRVGRLLVTLLLCAWGLLTQPLLYLSGYFERHRREYYGQLLDVSRRGEWEAWLQFFLRGIDVQARDSQQRIQRLRALQDNYRNLIGQQTRISSSLRQMIDLLFSQPLLTINQAAGQLNIPFQKASRHMKLLEKAGLVREMTGQSRNRVFVADAILKIIDAPFEEDDHAIRPF